VANECTLGMQMTLKFWGVEDFLLNPWIFCYESHAHAVVSPGVMKLFACRPLARVGGICAVATHNNTCSLKGWRFMRDFACFWTAI